MTNNYEQILDSPLMNEIWDGIDATTKYEILTKAGWDLEAEYEKVKK
jgi:hypothetical protein